MVAQCQPYVDSFSKFTVEKIVAKKKTSKLDWPSIDFVALEKLSHGQILSSTAENSTFYFCGTFDWLPVGKRNGKSWTKSKIVKKKQKT